MSGELDKMNAANAIAMRLLKFKENDSKAKAKIESSKTEETPEIKDASIVKKQENLAPQKLDSFGKAPEVTFVYQKPTAEEDTPIKKLKPPAPNKLSNSNADAA